MMAFAMTVIPTALGVDVTKEVTKVEEAAGAVEAVVGEVLEETVKVELRKREDNSKIEDSLPNANMSQ